MYSNPMDAAPSSGGVTRGSLSLRETRAEELASLVGRSVASHLNLDSHDRPLAGLVVGQLFTAPLDDEFVVDGTK